MAGCLIGKGGSTINKLRETYDSSVSYHFNDIELYYIYFRLPKILFGKGY